MSDIKDFQVEKGVLTAYHGNGGDLVIPEGVTHIKVMVFQGNWDITSIRLPESMTEVGYGVFDGCKNLKRVFLPETIQKIGSYAFMNCGNLTYINIPESVKTIGDYAFISCKKLKELHLPNDTEIAICAFKECDGLADGNGMVILKNILFDYIGKSLDIEIPEYIEGISGYVFRKYDRLENLTIKKNIPIGRNAFADNLWLENCTLLFESTDEEDAKQIIDAIGTRILAIPFLKGNLKTNTVLQNLLVKRMILKSNRSKLIQLLIEKDETELLAKFLRLVPKMPVEELDIYIQLSERYADIRAMFMIYKKHLYPPETLDKIESIQMEKDLGFRKKTIADYKKLFMIRKVNYRYLLRHYKEKSPYLLIPSMIGNLPVELCDEAFSHCLQIETVYIEEGIQTIPWRIFMDCKKLKTVNIPESVRNIESQAFYGCTNIESMTGAGGLIEIGYEAFGGCRQLKNITLPVGLKTIRSFAFLDCENLQYLTLPESVTEIEKYAFEGCPHLTICAPKGSYAETYAQTYRIKFLPK